MRELGPGIVIWAAVVIPTLGVPEVEEESPLGLGQLRPKVEAKEACVWPWVEVAGPNATSVPEPAGAVAVAAPDVWMLVCTVERVSPAGAGPEEAEVPGEAVSVSR